MFTDLVKDIEARTRKPRVIDCKELPDGYILLDNGEGAPEIKQVPAKRRRYEATSLTGLVQMIEYLHLEAGESSTCVFLGGQVTVCLDERGRRYDLGVMNLKLSEQMLRLMGMRNETPLEQKDMVWLLTSRFRDNILTTDFLPTIRNLKFKSSSEGTSRIQHGEESLGASIEEQAVTGKEGGTLPDLVEFEIPVFEFLDTDFAPTARIQCAVKFNIQEKTIVIRPEPCQISQARGLAEQELATILSTKVPAGVSILTGAEFDRA